MKKSNPNAKVYDETREEFYKKMTSDEKTRFARMIPSLRNVHCQMTLMRLTTMQMIPHLTQMSFLPCIVRI